MKYSKLSLSLLALIIATSNVTTTANAQMVNVDVSEISANLVTTSATTSNRTQITTKVIGGSNGTIAIVGNKTTATANSKVEFTITPKANYRIKKGSLKYTRTENGNQITTVLDESTRSVTIPSSWNKDVWVNATCGGDSYDCSTTSESCTTSTCKSNSHGNTCHYAGECFERKDSGGADYNCVETCAEACTPTTTCTTVTHPKTCHTPTYDCSGYVTRTYYSDSIVIEVEFELDMSNVDTTTYDMNFDGMYDYSKRADEQMQIGATYTKNNIPLDKEGKEIVKIKK